MAFLSDQDRFPKVKDNYPNLAPGVYHFETSLIKETSNLKEIGFLSTERRTKIENKKEKAYKNNKLAKKLSKEKKIENDITQDDLTHYDNNKKQEEINLKKSFYFKSKSQRFKSTRDNIPGPGKYSTQMNFGLGKSFKQIETEKFDKTKKKKCRTRAPLGQLNIPRKDRVQSLEYFMDYNKIPYDERKGVKKLLNILVQKNNEAIWT